MTKVNVFELKLDSNGLPLTAGKVSPSVRLMLLILTSTSDSLLRLNHMSSVSICKEQVVSAAMASFSPIIPLKGKLHLISIAV